MEHPRDPLEEPGPYECVPQGGFRRLMLATTFESPFAKKKLGLLSPLGLDEVGGLLAWRGLAWLGVAWLGLAWLGLAWYCVGIFPALIVLDFVLPRVVIAARQTSVVQLVDSG